MLTVFSIGLNIGAEEPRDQLARTLTVVSARRMVHDVALGAAEWQGVPERFAQFAIPENGPWWLSMMLARTLQQDAVAYLAPGAEEWRLVHKDGTETAGGTLAEFPCIVKRTED